MVRLFPTYRQKLKSEKPVVKTVKRWTIEAKLELQSYFDCTDGSVFKLLLLTWMTSYISRSEDMCGQDETYCTYKKLKSVGLKRPTGGVRNVSNTWC